MKTSSKVPTWATYGFFKALFDFIKQTQPQGLIIAFDKGRKTFRNKLYPEYKAHREAMPDDMKRQMQDIRRGVDALSIPVFEMGEFEADDLIGTLAYQARHKGLDVTVLTGDQDSFQIIDPDGHISLMMPGFTGGLSRYDRDKVIEKWGVMPEQVIDFKGLKGDTSDNIPGVPGVGDKTAAKLLQEFGTLENIYNNLDKVAGKKLQEKLIQYKEQAFLSKQLATIRLDVPIALSPEAHQFQVKQFEAFLAFLNEMEFKSLIQASPSVLQSYLDPAVVLPPSENGNGKPVVKTSEQGSLFNTTTSATSPAVQELIAASYEDDVFIPPHKIIASLSEFQEFLDAASQAGVLCLDIETTGLDPRQDHIVGIAFSYSKAVSLGQEETSNPLRLEKYATERSILTLDDNFSRETIQSIYVPLQHGDASGNISPENVFKHLQAIFEDQHVAKIAHNAKFEEAFFNAVGLKFNGLVFDTMLANYVLNPEQSNGLKALGFDILGIRMRELKTLLGSGKNQILFDQIDLKEAAAYASLDTYVTLALAAHYIAELENKPELKTLFYEVELPLLHVLCKMEQAGISLDELYLRHLSEQLGVQLVDLEEDIYREAGLRFNVNSPKQVADVLFGHLQIPSKEKTASKSGLSTNAKILETLAEEHPVVQHILDYRQLFKLKSTYVDALPSLISPKDQRLHTSFNQAVTATGRLSSSNPNLQNIPIRSELGRSIRKAFVPKDRKNYCIISADYSQIELRLLAHFSEDPNLMKAFEEGLDVHKATASLVFDVPLDKVTKEMRYQAKTVNFGVIYGQTAFGLSKTLGIFPGEAAAFIEKYFAQYPNVREFIESTKQKAYNTGVATTLLGRVRDVAEGLASKQKHLREFTERTAFNTPLQGSASDLIKLAMIRLDQALVEENADSKLIMQVHDEVVVEAHFDEVEWLQETIKWAMCLDQPLKVPLVVDIAVGENWMDAD